MLSFEVVDFPDQNSFFKFIPSLKSQNDASNYVYDNNCVKICSSKVICNRNPYFYIPDQLIKSS